MVPFVGPSYSLTTRKADAQRSVNLYPKRVESGSGKAEWILESIAGLDVFADLGAELRGMFLSAKGTLYAVAGNTAYRVSSGGVGTSLGAISTSTGAVDFAENNAQAIFVTGPTGYVIDVTSHALTQIGSAAFYGSARVDVIDGYALFTRPDTGVFYISAINDALTYDALEFASAEGMPDNLVAVIADRREAFLMGAKTTERWFNSGSTDFPFSRDSSGFFQVGCSAAQTPRRLGTSIFWVGGNDEGDGIVWRLEGSQPVRVSTHAIEEAIRSSTDISSARGYAYQDGGHAFYCLNVPGLETTWCYDISSQSWHERAELVDGAYTQHRATCHAYAFGKHLFGAADGKIYAANRSTNTNAGDVLVRDRISPHYAQPSLERVFFGRFELDATAGDAPSGTIPMVSMRYSNDGGRNWNSWRARELGRTGETNKRPFWAQNGAGRDRVWAVRCTDNAPFSIISARVDA